MNFRFISFRGADLLFCILSEIYFYGELEYGAVRMIGNKYVTLFNADCSSEMIISLNRMIAKLFFVRKKLITPFQDLNYRPPNMERALFIILSYPDVIIIYLV